MKALFQHRFFLRLFSCLLCLGLLFAFPLNVSAEDGSSEVLDVRDFTYECYYGDDNENNEKLPLTVTDATFGSDGIWMRNYSCSSNASVKTLILTDLTDLIAEHEYNLEFYYATDYINTTVLGIELRYYTSTGEWIKTQTLAQFTPKKVGNQLYSGNFKPDVSGINQSYNIKLCILFLTPNTSTCSWRISHDIKLTDKDDDSGWFQKILNAIKAIPNNIKSFFTNLGASIKADLGDLGTAIDGFISDLSTDFSGFIDSLGSSISGDLDSQTQAQGGFFENLKLKLQAIGDALTETFENISADFTARFEMFKPRVYEDLHWINAMVNGSSGAVNTKPEVIVKYRAVTSELFYVSSGTVYNFVVDTGLSYFKSFQIYQYYDNDDYLGVFYDSSKSGYASGDVIVLPEEYSYRFCLQFTTSLSDLSSSELSDLCNDYVKLYADEGWLNAFGRLIIKGVTGLFIPSDAFFDDVYARVLDFYESKFGIFAQTTTLFYDVLNVADDVFSTVSYDFVFPEVSVPIAGKNIVVIEETVVDIGFWLENGSFGARLYKIYQLSVWAIIIYCVLKYALRVEDVVFGTSKSISFDDNPKHNHHL